MLQSVMFCALMVMGCAGVTEYKLTTPSGAIVEVRNTKDYDSYELVVVKQADGSYSVRLTATGVSASNPIKASHDIGGGLIGTILEVVE